MVSIGVSFERVSLYPGAVFADMSADFFEIIALSEPLDKEILKKKITREQAAEVIRGKVLGWGMWTSKYERTWS